MRDDRESTRVGIEAMRLGFGTILLAGLLSAIGAAPALADGYAAAAMEEAVLRVLTPAQAEAFARGVHPATIILPSGESLEAYMERLEVVFALGVQDHAGIAEKATTIADRITIQYSPDVDKVSIIGRTANYSFYSAWDWGSMTFSDLSFSGARVGINTTTPARTLDVAGEIGAQEGFLVYYPATGVWANAGCCAPYSRVNADSFHTNGLGVGQMFIEGSAIDSNTTINLGRGVAGAQNPRDVRIGDNNEVFVDTSTNRVGIGVSSPDEKLEVAGNIKLSGSIVSDGDICIGSGC